MFRVIAIDLQSTGATGGKIVAAGVAYCDGEVGALKCEGHGSRRFQFAGITLPTVDGEGVLNDNGDIVNPEGVLDYGSFEPLCWEEFWAHLSSSVRYELLLATKKFPPNSDTWREVRVHINELCTEAVLAGRKPVIVSDNPAFDIGVTDSELRKLGSENPNDDPPWSLLYIPCKVKHGVVCPPSYSPIRTTNTAWKLREKGIIDYPDITVEGAEHSHLPEEDAMGLATNYVSFISRYWME
jgi:hypothetical protein